MVGRGLGCVRLLILFCNRACLWQALLLIRDVEGGKSLFDLGELLARLEENIL